MEVICIDKRIFDELAARFSMIERKATGMYNPTKDAELKRQVDDQEVYGVLRMSKRTLQVYREKRLLPLTRVKNEFFYKPGDMQNMLGSNYHPQKRKP